MKYLRYKFIVYFANFIIDRIKSRSRLIERIFDICMTEDEYRSVEKACELQGSYIGSFYKWKFIQWAVISEGRRLNSEEIKRFVTWADRSSYSGLISSLECSCGILVAMPHYGHFLLSIGALAYRIQEKRTVNIFFDPPDKHATNAVFVEICEKMYKEYRNVNILHNNKSGLLRAIKELRRGAVVVIMPDVFEKIDDTYDISFLGRTRCVALGAAYLARITGAIIVPSLSRLHGRFCFESVFGEPIKCNEFSGSFDKIASIIYDYKNTSLLFRRLEYLMGKDLIQWQYIRGHFNAPPPLPELPYGSVGKYLELFLSDPRIKVDLSCSIEIAD